MSDPIIKFIRHRGHDVIHENPDDFGFESMTRMFDGKMNGIQTVVEEEIDFVLLQADCRSLDWLKTNGKPPGWKKVLITIHVSPIEFNSYAFWRHLDCEHIDGIYCHGTQNAEIFCFMDKPIITGFAPYKMLNLPRKNKKTKACLNIKDFKDKNVNLLGTLSVFKLLKIPGVVSIHPGLYHKYHDLMIELIDKFKLDIKILPKFNSRKEYLYEISDCQIMINMDIRWGQRVVMDAVENRMICIGAWNALQEIFYKDYTVQNHEVLKAFKIAEKVINNYKEYEPPDMNFMSPDTVKKKLLENLHEAFKI